MKMDWRSVDDLRELRLFLGGVGTVKEKAVDEIMRNKHGRSGEIAEVPVMDPHLSLARFNPALVLAWGRETAAADQDAKRGDMFMHKRWHER